MNSLEHRRDVAERLLNGVRAAVLLVLVAAALMYAPQLPRVLNLANLWILTPALAWTMLQYALWYRAPALPSWLALVNPIVDVTAVTLVIGSYALAQSSVLALRSPIFMMYFVVLAARPVASSARKAGFVAVLVVIEYAALLTVLAALHRIPFETDPVAAVSTGRITPLDETAKLSLLAVAGLVAIYATSWAEQLAVESGRESEERNRVATKLAQAELDTLKLQLNPHFLFNSLNGVLALIGSDPKAAEQMVSGLSEFLRLVLTSSAEQEVPLERELALLGRYAELQQIRFGANLRVEILVPDELRRAMVPSLLLQPLVENAIRHGVSQRANLGLIRVTAERSGTELRIKVEDDGVGSHASRSRQRSRGTGLGLVNTATRLAHLYPGKHAFVHGDRAGGGYSVEMTVPFRIGRLTPLKQEAAFAEAVGAGAALD